jgi:uracil phosphoribosyltransferase
MDFSPFVDAAATLACYESLNNSEITPLQISTTFATPPAQEAGDTHLSVVNVRSTALAAMVSYVKQTVPAAVSHFGLSDDSIAQKAAARLATALHISTVPATAVAAPAPTAVTQVSPAPAAA